MPLNKEELDELNNYPLSRASIQTLLDEEEPDRVSITPKKVKKIKIFKYTRIAIFFIIWILFTSILLLTHESKVEWHISSVPVGTDGKFYPIKNPPDEDSLTLFVSGPFTYMLTDILGHEKISTSWKMKQDSIFFLNINVYSYRLENDGKLELMEISKACRIGVVSSKDFDKETYYVRKQYFTLNRNFEDTVYYYKFTLENIEEPLPILLQSYPVRIPTPMSVLYSTVVLFSLYLFLFWDITSKAIVLILFCTLSIAIMGVYSLRPMLPDIPKFVDIDMILVLLGLTIIVGVFAETAGDQYLAVQVFRFSRGHIWPMLSVILLITFICSAVLDQLTTIMLITLFLLRYCEIAQLNAGNVLTSVMLFSNIGSMLTPSDSLKKFDIMNSQIHLTNSLSESPKFVKHMAVPVILSAVMTYIYLRIYFHSTQSMRNVEAPIVSRLKHVIRLWSHTAKRLGDYSAMEKEVQQNVRNKIGLLRARLRRLGKMPIPVEDFNTKLQRLRERHKLKNKRNVIMCCIIIGMVLAMQITYSISLHYLSPGWNCLLFSLILLALVDWHDFESLMTQISWSTVLLITCVMIITRAMAPLGLLNAMSDSIVEIISGIEKTKRLYLSVVILTCASAFCSVFFDHAYVCFLMYGKIGELIETSDIPLPVEPLFMAVVLGAGFGCNATLISSFANIVCSGLVEKHDFKLYFWDFFKIGSIVMVFSTAISIIYILVYVNIFYQ